MYADGYHSVAIVPPRGLALEKRAILDFMLEPEFAGQQEIRELLDGTRDDRLPRPDELRRWEDALID